MRENVYHLARESECLPGPEEDQKMGGLWFVRVIMQPAIVENGTRLKFEPEFPHEKVSAYQDQWKAKQFLGG